MSCQMSATGVKEENRVTMDVKKKEMDLLSNSIAAYAHIKGKPQCEFASHFLTTFNCI